MVHSSLFWANNKLIDHLSTETLRRLGEPYLAGHSLEHGLEVMQRYYDGRRIYSTFDILGESAKTVAEADRYFDAYLKFLVLLPNDFVHQRSPRYRPVSISVKPSAICVIKEKPDEAIVNSETPLIPRLEKIVSAARDLNIDVTLDMEDHRYTNLSLEAVKTLLAIGYHNLGKVSQARLKRTTTDNYQSYASIQYNFPHHDLRDRICQGIYLEPETIAATKKEDIKEQLRLRTKELFDYGIYVEIATHDKHIIRSALEYIKSNDISPDHYEFQFLK